MTTTSTAVAALRVQQVGPLATIQDGGRHRWRRVGVGPSGFADRTSAALANRLAGNPPDAALVEVVVGGLVVATQRPVTVAVAGAPCPIRVDGRAVGGPTLRLDPGAILELGAAPRGLRCYLAVAGGIRPLDGGPVLGSWSTDGLGGLGPPPLRPGDLLVAGPSSEQVPAPPDVVAWLSDPSQPVPVTPGPHLGWFAEGTWEQLTSRRWTAGAADRVGVRLEGVALERSRSGELATIALVRGAIQVAAGGRPMVMGADHPSTGGYPVVAVCTPIGADRMAQVRPGEEIEFVPTSAVAGA